MVVQATTLQPGRMAARYTTRHADRRTALLYCPHDHQHDPLSTLHNRHTIRLTATQWTDSPNCCYPQQLPCHNYKRLDPSWPVCAVCAASIVRCQRYVGAPLRLCVIMSTIGGSRERELQSLLKQKESELKQANAELVSLRVWPARSVHRGVLGVDHQNNTKWLTHSLVLCLAAHWFQEERGKLLYKTKVGCVDGGSWKCARSIGVQRHSACTEAGCCCWWTCLFHCGGMVPTAGCNRAAPAGANGQQEGGAGDPGGSKPGS